MQGQPRFITAAGFDRLRDEYQQLFSVDRPKLVETIAWAAANGDRSENGDYIYGASACARSTGDCRTCRAS